MKYMNDEIRSADHIVRELVADIMAAHGNDFNEAMDTLMRDWPDLAVTFKKAHAYVESD